MKNPGLPLHARVRIRLRRQQRPYRHDIEDPLVQLQKIGLYGWHYYGYVKRKEYLSGKSQMWFSEEEARGR